MTRPCRRCRRWIATCWSLTALLVANSALRGESAPALPRAPVVIVPGAPATELVERGTGKIIWPGVARMLWWHGNDALTLDIEHPESTTLEPGKLLRWIKIAGLKVLRFRGYDGLEDKLRSLGYAEGNISAPRPDQYYYFLYDWRLSVESNARKFQSAMRELYAQLPPATPRAVVVGHSIGGLIARYALMYGETPLGESGPLPPVTWEGAASVETLYLVATPNAGAFLGLEAMQRGSFWWKHWGAFSPEVLATFPAMWDLMPARPDPLVDHRGQALGWALDRVEDWESLGWGPLRPGSGFGRGSASVEMVRRQLARGSRLREALLQTGKRPNPTVLHLIGGECQTAQRTAVVLERPGRSPSIRFKRPRRGAAELDALLREPGDSMISARTVRAEGLPQEPAGSLFFESSVYSCAPHNGLPSTPELLAQLDRTLRTADTVAAKARSDQRPARLPGTSASSNPRLRSIPQR